MSVIKNLISGYLFARTMEIIPVPLPISTTNLLSLSKLITSINPSDKNERNNGKKQKPKTKKISKGFFGLTDFVIFNFDDILTSGSIILALNYNKKVIAPAMGCIKDIRNENLILFDSKNSDSNLEKVLQNLLKQ